MPKKELSKCRVWERQRRDRMKNSFFELEKVLPSYDPSITISRLEVLHRATAIIEDLKRRNKLALSGGEVLNEETKRELNYLHNRCISLINRLEQLAGLLKKAGISIPNEIELEKEFSKPKLWSNKITPEQSEKINQKLPNTKNNELKTKSTTSVLKKAKERNKNRPKANILYGNKLVAKRSPAKLKKKVRPTISTQSVKNSNKDGKRNKSLSNMCLNTKASIAPTTFILGNAVFNKAPTSKTADLTKTTPPISTLGPGTLILANGEILPILPGPNQSIIQPQAVLLTTVLKPQPANQTLVILNNKPTTSSEITKPKLPDPIESKANAIQKTYQRIVPDLGGTKVTTVNKVPIPALTSRFSAQHTNKIIKGKENLNKKTQGVLKIPKSSEVEPKKKLRRVETEQVTVEGKPDSSEKSSVYSVDSLCKVNEDKAIEDESKENDTAKADTVEKPKIPTKEVSASEPVVAIQDAVSTAIVSTPMGPISVSTSTSHSKPVENSTINTDFSSDLFASLNVSAGAHHPESISPTAAFLLAFPLVSTCTGGKISENAGDCDDNSNSQQHENATPTLLQIGNIDSKPTDTPNLFDNIPSFFETKKQTDYSKTSPNKKETSCLFAEIPPLFQTGMTGNMFNYEHVPVTTYQNKTKTDLKYNDFLDESVAMKTNLHLVKTSTPFISRVETRPENEQFKYPEIKSDKKLVNWMTTPDRRNKVDGFNYGNTSYYPESGEGKSLGEPYYQKPYANWTPQAKTTLETPNCSITPSTLPMLVGDLALNTTTSNEKPIKACEGNTFLSVSQLVDNNKPDVNKRKQQPCANKVQIKPALQKVSEKGSFSYESWNKPGENEVNKLVYTENTIQNPSTGKTSDLYQNTSKTAPHQTQNIFKNNMYPVVPKQLNQNDKFTMNKQSHNPPNVYEAPKSNDWDKSKSTSNNETKPNLYGVDVPKSHDWTKGTTNVSNKSNLYETPKFHNEWVKDDSFKSSSSSTYKLPNISNNSTVSNNLVKTNIYDGTKPQVASHKLHDNTTGYKPAEYENERSQKFAEIPEKPKLGASSVNSFHSSVSTYDANRGSNVHWNKPDESLHFSSNTNQKSCNNPIISNIKSYSADTLKSTDLPKRTNNPQLFPASFDQNRSYDWNYPTSKPNQFKNTYSAESLIGNSSQNTFQKSYATPQQQYTPTKRITPFEPNLFYEFDSNYYPPTTTIYQPSSFMSTNTSNMINSFITDFDTDFITNTNNMLPTRHKNKSPAKSYSQTSTKRTVTKRKSDILTTFPDLTYLPATTTSDELFYPNYFTTNTPIYSSNTPNSSLYCKTSQQDFNSCNLLPPPPIPSASTLTHNNLLPLPPPLPPTISTSQSVYYSSASSAAPLCNTASSSTASALTNFNLSTIFPEINKPMVSGASFDSTPYKTNNLPTATSNQTYGNYSNI